MPDVKRVNPTPNGPKKPPPAPIEDGVFGRVRTIGFDDDIGLKVLLYGASGTGKCLGIGTPVLMYDGSIKRVEEVSSGDRLMGPDSKPREVLTTSTGTGPLYRVIPTKGESWVCNDAHILTLIGSGPAQGKVIDIAVKDYLKEAPHRQRNWKLWRVSVEFEATKKSLPLPPYLVGLWLGDGSISNGRIHNSKPAIHQYCLEIAESLGYFCEIEPEETGSYRISFTKSRGSGRRGAPKDEKGRYLSGVTNPLQTFLTQQCVSEGVKKIPAGYLTASRDERMQLLAGIIDTDGEECSYSGTSVTVTGEPYKESLLFLCRSLGFSATCGNPRVHRCSSGKVSTYYRISISGDLDTIPTKVRRFPPRRQVKRVGVVGFKIEEEGSGSYYGFTLSGDGRFVLGDFTVTHNTTFWSTFPAPILAVICSGSVTSGELRSVDTPENRKRIKSVYLERSEEITEIANGAVQHGFKTVVLDHVSGLSDLLFKELLGLAEIPAQKQFLGKKSQEIYGKLAQEGKELLADLLNLTCNVVIIGQERVFGGKEEGLDPEVVKPSIGVATTPALASWLAPTCDYVIQTFKRPRTKVSMVSVLEGQPPQEVVERVKGIDYCLRCEPHDIYQTKFRMPKGRTPPDVIVDPDYSKLIAAIRGKS